MSILEKLKVASTKEEKVEALNDFLATDMDKDTLEYIKSRSDLMDISAELKKENKISLKSLLGKIDAYNKDHHPELVPNNPDSIDERTELLKKYKNGKTN